MIQMLGNLIKKYWALLAVVICSIVIPVLLVLFKINDFKTPDEISHVVKSSTPIPLTILLIIIGIGSMVILLTLIKDRLRLKIFVIILFIIGAMIGLDYILGYISDLITYKLDELNRMIAVVSGLIFKIMISYIMAGICLIIDWKLRSESKPTEIA